MFECVDVYNNLIKQNLSNLKPLFTKFDSNQDGFLDLSELTQFTHCFQPSLNEEEIEKVMESTSKDNFKIIDLLQLV